MLTLALWVGGCSGPERDPNYVTFSYEMVQRYDLKPEEIKQIQFYLNRSTQLDRVVLSNQERHVKGRLISRSGQLCEIIDFPCGTPGVVVAVRDDRRILSVSFEPGFTLDFEVDPDSFHQYYKMSTLASNKYKVRYGGYEYGVTTPPNLSLDEDAMNRTITKRRVVPGLRLP